MDIAALSMVLNQAKVRQLADISLMKKTMDQGKQDTSQLVKMMEQSVQPHLGGKVDLKG